MATTRHLVVATTCLASVLGAMHFIEPQNMLGGDGNGARETAAQQPILPVRKRNATRIG